jgi:hypothetical protein
MKKDTSERGAETPESRREERPTATRKDPAKGLDFSKLDLSVERVDERMSPSETNIFDK